jgi:hypothetical protein
VSKIYAILLDNNKIGTSLLEYADPPMGVVFGKIEIISNSINHSSLLNYCNTYNIEIATNLPEDKLITVCIPALQVFNEEGIEIKGEGNVIEGMDSEGFQISILGVPYPFFEEEFPHHVKEYKDRFK